MLENDTTFNDQFWQKWCVNRESLFRQCVKWSKGDIELADDILSEAMILAYTKYHHHHKNISNIDAWFYALTHNVFIQYQRRKKRYYEFLKEYECKWNATYTKENYPGHNENKNILEKLVSQLPYVLRNTTRLYLLGYSYSFISESLNINKATARKRVSLAKEKLNNQFNDR